MKVLENQVLTLTHPISLMEKDMVAMGIKKVNFVEHTKPHGYIKVKDDQGCVWICHPESFQELR
jgi:hypothetical protein